MNTTLSVHGIKIRCPRCRNFMKREGKGYDLCHYGYAQYFQWAKDEQNKDEIDYWLRTGDSVVFTDFDKFFANCQNCGLRFKFSDNGEFRDIYMHAVTTDPCNVRIAKDLRYFNVEVKLKKRSGYQPFEKEKLYKLVDVDASIYEDRSDMIRRKHLYEDGKRIE